MVLVLLQFTQPISTEDRIPMYFIYAGTAFDTLAAASVYWDVYKEYLRWCTWTQCVEDSDDGKAWTFFYFGMDREEQMNVLDHEPPYRLGIIKRIYREYEMTGAVNACV
jgi:hypothetical protein